MPEEKGKITTEEAKIQILKSELEASGDEGLSRVAQILSFTPILRNFAVTLILKFPSVWQTTTSIEPLILDSGNGNIQHVCDKAESIFETFLNLPVTKVKDFGDYTKDELQYIFSSAIRALNDTTLVMVQSEFESIYQTQAV